ncbi:hypothetical protein FGG08_005440 [Glutinoglossum americanum]|uniref:DUF6594 domain-containing protein n=1 Tax=Glutinoglossum americanum TaxID=1670608 RepID=A0A9P8L2V8_9PEZI|nr:hypothetical protein FGG08_005440 [Glutinoglossum americanum]
MHPSPKIPHSDLESGSVPDIGYMQPCHSQNSHYAARIANEGGKSAIYQRFEGLAARNILHLESELAWLEAKQDKLDKEAEASGSSVNNADELTPDDDDDGGPSKELPGKLQVRLRLSNQIRRTLKEYYKSLYLAQNILSLPAPSPQALKSLRKRSPSLKKGSKISTKSATPLSIRKGVGDRDKLCVLGGPEPGALLNEERVSGEGGNGGGSVWDFRWKLHQNHALLSSILNILAATGFLIGAIVGLYFVTRPGFRLLMISLLIAAFAGWLAVMTNASGEGVFLATAAYAAVLVVFVSGNLAAASALYANGINPNSLGAVGSPVTVSVTSTVVKMDISTVFRTMTQTTASAVSTSATAIASPAATPSTAAVRKGLSSGNIAGIVAGSLVGWIGLLYVIYRCFPKFRHGEQ